MNIPLPLGLLLLAACLPAQAREKQADIIIKNAKIVTMDADLHVIDDGTIVIDGKKIIAIGDARLAGQYTATEVIDAAGNIAMPGMINTHNHIPMLAFRGLGEYRNDDKLFKFFFPLESKMLSRNLINVASKQAAMELALTGVTTVVDMYYHEDEVARAVRDVGIRGVLGETVINFPVVDAKTPYGGFDYAINYIREFKGDELITPAIAPHAPYSVSPEMLVKIRKAADEYQVPVLMHLAEFHGEWDLVKQRFPEAAKYATEIQYLDGYGVLQPNLLAAHVIQVNDADMDILKARRVGIAHNPKANTKGWNGLAPAWDMYRKGLDVGLGTDGPLSSNQMDIVSVIGYAERVAMLQHLDATTYTPPQLVALATISGAKALKMDDRIGSLEVGKLADVILVNTKSANMQPMYDVYSTLAYQTNPGDIYTTIVNGQVVARDGKILTIDLARQQHDWNQVTHDVAEFAKTLDY